MGLGRTINEWAAMSSGSPCYLRDGAKIFQFLSQRLRVGDSLAEISGDVWQEELLFGGHHPIDRLRWVRGVKADSLLARSGGQAGAMRETASQPTRMRPATRAQCPSSDGATGMNSQTTPRTTRIGRDFVATKYSNHVKLSIFNTNFALNVINFGRNSVSPIQRLAVNVAVHARVCHRMWIEGRLLSPSNR